MRRPPIVPCHCLALLALSSLFLRDCVTFVTKSKLCTKSRLASVFCVIDVCIVTFCVILSPFFPSFVAPAILEAVSLLSHSQVYSCALCRVVL